MNGHRLAAIAQVVLEGVPLPAEKAQLLEYARRQHASTEVAEALTRIEPASYRSLDEVGEAILAHRAPEQPERIVAPRPESGAVPGGEAYLDASAEPGAVRDEPETLPYEEQLVRTPAGD